MRPLLVILLALAAVAPPARSQATGAGAFSLAATDATPRGAALAGAVSAGGRPDAGAWLYNPALLSPDLSGRFTAQVSNLPSSVAGGGFGYARSFAGLGEAAVVVRFLGWGEMDRTSTDGAPAGTFTARELALTVTAARRLRPNLRAGASLHALRSTIDAYGASAASLDAGLAWSAVERGLSAGVSVHHAGLVLSSLGATRDELPFDVRLGVAKRLRHMPLLLSATAYGFFSDAPLPDGGPAGDAFSHLLLGAEFQFSDAFQVRLGYDHRLHEALKIKSRLDFAGVGVGIGMRVRGIRVDWSRSSWSSLGSVHRFALSVGP